MGVAGTVMLTGSILNNQGGDVVNEPGNDSERPASHGHNLLSDNPGSGLDPTGLINTDPSLGPLADNGGATFTHVLQPGSPAIGTEVAIPGVSTDQCGVSRPRDAVPEVGANETVGVPGATPLL